MNKHVAKLQKDASEARKAIEYSDSDSSESEDENRSRRKNKPAERPTEDQVCNSKKYLIRIWNRPMAYYI